ncbi:MAG: FAD-binding domain-containing protein [Rubrimonas sp.]|uniref:deoxyribodipyrimidine photo-lyase n=1 Tax=Rubrimonas sp. TaxID=2036015 RepID=UPI002FDE68A0
MPTTIVWFKRDLRAEDHAPLCAAAARGGVVPLYLAEPELWAQPTTSARHWAFISESLRELQADLAARGAPLIVRTGEAVEALSEVAAHTGADAIFAHQETGDLWTFARDRRVAAWARGAGLELREWQAGGVVRRLRGRDGWAARWERTMREAALPAPQSLQGVPGLDPGAIPDAKALGLAPDPCPERQSGGRRAALATLDTFLAVRGRDYRRAMSSPVTGFDACSRLSTHLAWGMLSSREAAQAGWARQAQISAEGAAPGWAGSVDSFLSRLHWRCHFMQKLEDEPEIERRCMHRAYEGLREDAHDPARLAAWEAGETGFPFVDACMRALRATGWMNFRMRSMLTAFAAYHLWLDWRRLAPPLARLFADYEPGIHYSQLQMQSGVTGINTTRIYNPVKQSMDQDPQGAFIRRWVPELAGVPLARLHEPWRMSAEEQRAAGCALGRDYPAPIVDHAAAARAAKARVWAVRAGPAFRMESAEVLRRHASRRRDREGPSRKPRPDPRQSAFEF